MKTEIFNYNGNPVTFKLENGEVMVSATEMAKPFGKKANDWLRLKQTKEYITALMNASGIPDPSDLVIVKNGDEGGTIMHEDVALEFARWLSPRFGIWCNSKIKELLKTGVTTVSDDDEIIARAIEVLRNRYNKQLERNEQLTKKLDIVGPKAEYYDDVLRANGCYTTTMIAKEVGKSAEGLNKLLNEAKIQYQQRGVWVLYAKYQNKGYTKTHTYLYDKKDGSQGSRMATVWSEKGREFIHKLIKKIGECGDLIK